MKEISISTLIVLTALTGCAPAPAPVPDEPAPARTPPASAPAQPSVDRARLDALLDRGFEALEEDRLLTPMDSSAYDYFQAALALDADNAAARRGLERIVQRYLTLARNAAERRDFAHARSMLRRAGIVDGSHDGIALAARQIALLERSRRRVIALDASALDARDAAVRQALAGAGDRARAEDARVVIVARSDAEGRWMYQQMRQGPGNERIRAAIEIGATPRIELIVLHEVP